MIRVLVVDDDPVVARVHRSYVERVAAFEVVGVAEDGASALDRLARDDVDLVLLDLRMPGVDGLEVCRRLRAEGSTVDIIVVSSARDLDAVRAALQYGVLHYLIKPFTFSALRVKLESYAEFQLALDGVPEFSTQQEIDHALSMLRHPVEHGLPKTIAPETLKVVLDVLRAHPDGLTASQLGELARLSRVSARRYLEFLLGSDEVVREPVRSPGAGRPLLRYRRTRSDPP